MCANDVLSHRAPGKHSGSGTSFSVSNTEVPGYPIRANVCDSGFNHHWRGSGVGSVPEIV